MWKMLRPSVMAERLLLPSVCPTCAVVIRKERKDSTSLAVMGTANAMTLSHGVAIQVVRRACMHAC